MFSPKQRAILNRIQSDFPITLEPYHYLAQELGISEKELLIEIKRLKLGKIIRRIGVIFNTLKIGFVSTLIGLKVSPERLESVGKKIARFPEVTHCYERNHEFNLWFTLTCKSKKELNSILDDITKWNGIQSVLLLPAIKTFKIKTEFKFN